MVSNFITKAIFEAAVKTSTGISPLSCEGSLTTRIFKTSAGYQSIAHIQSCHNFSSNTFNINNTSVPEAFFFSFLHYSITMHLLVLLHFQPIRNVVHSQAECVPRSSWKRRTFLLQLTATGGSCTTQAAHGTCPKLALPSNTEQFLDLFINS